jgi:multiple sugar transport system substrate-binding protein
MTPEVFTWDASSNNRAMLAGTISLALNAISITRTGEEDNPTFTEKIHLAKAAAGPVPDRAGTCDGRVRHLEVRRER